MQNNVRKNGLALTERDNQLFRYLFLQKLARISDIQEDVFGGVTRQAVHRRILKLTKERYLTGIYLPGLGRSLAYSLGVRALKECISEQGALSREQTKSASPIHDLGLVDIRRWLLTQARVKALYSENGISTGLFDDEPGIADLKGLNADAIVKFAHGERSLLLPLEYEASAKFSARYERVVRRYYQHQKVEAVLYLAKNMHTIEKIMRAEKKEKGPHKFFYSLWGEPSGEIKFRNLDGAEINLNA